MTMSFLALLLTAVFGAPTQLMNRVISRKHHNSRNGLEVCDTQSLNIYYNAMSSCGTDGADIWCECAIDEFNSNPSLSTLNCMEHEESGVLISEYPIICESILAYYDYYASYDYTTSFESECSSHDDCQSGTFCNQDGFCDVCYECHHCHDGIDDTCGHCGEDYPTEEDTCWNDLSAASSKSSFVIAGVAFVILVCAGLSFYTANQKTPQFQRKEFDVAKKWATVVQVLMILSLVTSIVAALVPWIVIQSTSDDFKVVMGPLEWTICDEYGECRRITNEEHGWGPLSYFTIFLGVIAPVFMFSLICHSWNTLCCPWCLRVFVIVGQLLHFGVVMVLGSLLALAAEGLDEMASEDENLLKTHQPATICSVLSFIQILAWTIILCVHSKKFRNMRLDKMDVNKEKPAVNIPPHEASPPEMKAVQNEQGTFEIIV